MAGAMSGAVIGNRALILSGIVILSGVGSSRSELPTQSKDPYCAHSAADREFCLSATELKARQASSKGSFDFAQDDNGSLSDHN